MTPPALSPTSPAAMHPYRAPRHTRPASPGFLFAFVVVFCVLVGAVFYALAQ